MLEHVPSRAKCQALRYVPRALPSGDPILSEIFLLVLAVRTAYRACAAQIYFGWLGYLARWSYASAQPVGKHSSRVQGPRHAAKTPLLQQFGISQRFWSRLSALEESVESAPNLA
jgi:hypothetical protein